MLNVKELRTDILWINRVENPNLRKLRFAQIYERLGAAASRTIPNHHKKVEHQSGATKQVSNVW